MQIQVTVLSFCDRNPPSFVLNCAAQWKQAQQNLWLFCYLTCGWLLLQGPLSVFCARARWGPVHVICLRRREGGLGLTLRGDSPVLVAGVVPGGCAAVRSAATPPASHMLLGMIKHAQKMTLTMLLLKFI